MKVVSPLATVDFRVGRVARERNALVVSSRTGDSIPTQVYVRPQDVLELLGALCRSRAGLGFICLFPLYWWRARREPVVSAHRAANNPWK
ncbi:MAG: hypothetical protein WA642_22180 [Steroidobacteraceae bacterium]